MVKPSNEWLKIENFPVGKKKKKKKGRKKALNDFIASQRKHDYLSVHRKKGKKGNGNLFTKKCFFSDLPIFKAVDLFDGENEYLLEERVNIKFFSIFMIQGIYCQEDRS